MNIKKGLFKEQDNIFYRKQYHFTSLHWGKYLSAAYFVQKSVILNKNHVFFMTSHDDVITDFFPKYQYVPLHNTCQYVGS